MCHRCHNNVVTAGRLITELRVPGIKCGFVKRPYDIGLQVQVEDLFLVDPILAFGPGYELVICSSGSNLLNLSSPSSVRSNKDDFTTATSLLSPHTPIRATSDDTSELDYSVFSNDGLPIELFSTGPVEDDHALLVFSYSLLTPDSPQHPATRDEEQETDSHMTHEPSIHSISLQCTAVDVIGESL